MGLSENGATPIPIVTISPLRIAKGMPQFQRTPVYQIIGVYPNIFPLYHHLQMIIFNFDG